jgi:hypothetical protein
LVPLLAGAYAATLQDCDAVPEENVKKCKLSNQCERAKDFYGDCNCQDWFWKGGKLGKNLIAGRQDDNDVAMFQISIPDGQSTFSFRDPDSSKPYVDSYKVFLQFARKNCGPQVLDAMVATDDNGNHPLQFHFMDAVQVYSGQYRSSFVEKYDGYDASAYVSKPPKKQWAVTVQFHATTPMEDAVLHLHSDVKKRADLPYTATKTNGNIEVSFPKKKDQLVVFVTGLKDVTMTDAQLESCFRTAFVGVAMCENEGCVDEPNSTECANLAHIYW